MERDNEGGFQEQLGRTHGQNQGGDGDGIKGGRWGGLGSGRVVVEGGGEMQTTVLEQKERKENPKT